MYVCMYVCIDIHTYIYIYIYIYTYIYILIYKYTHILDEIDCISHRTHTLGKGMNTIILPPAMGK